MKLNLEQIPRIKTITKEEFLGQYVAQQKPVVIEHLIQDDWPAYKKWNLNYIKEIAGDKTVPLYDDRPLTSKLKVNQPHTTMKMSEYIDLLKKDATNYRIFLYNLLKKVPVLQKDFNFPDLGLKFMKKMPMLFFGGGGSKVLMHYDIDLANILHFHFHGEKRCIIFPPSETKYLYKVPHALIAHQGIDFENPDFEKWPALEKAKGYVTNLKHGETLYMPEGYWHQMTYLTPGFSMSIRSTARGVKNFSTAVYNVFIMRHFDNMMRKIGGQQWMDYKNTEAIKRTDKKNGFLTSKEPVL